VFLTLPSRPPSRFRQIAPRLPFFSAPSANSASKSPHSHSSQLPRPAEPPMPFPLFPQSVNMAHTQTPASPSPSIVYFTLLCIPGKMHAAALILPYSRRMPTPPPILSVRNSFKRNAYKKLGGGISTSRAIGSEPSARNNAGPSIPVFPFDFERSTACPEPRRGDLFSPARPLRSRNTRKSRISNAYRKQGGLNKLRSAELRHPPHYSLFTTHYSLPQSLRYTMPSREP
jgi:hypothetical protein